MAMTGEQLVIEMFGRGMTKVNYRGSTIEFRNGRYHVQGGSYHGTVARAVAYIDQGIARSKTKEGKAAAWAQAQAERNSR